MSASSSLLLPIRLKSHLLGLSRMSFNSRRFSEQFGPNSTYYPYMLFICVTLYVSLSVGRPFPRTSKSSGILLNCGSSVDGIDSSGRTWTSNNESYFATQSKHSLPSTASLKDISIPEIPYWTTFVFHSDFNFSFPLIPGCKLIRLHFHFIPSNHGIFASQAIFTVKVGSSSVHLNFSASKASKALDHSILVKKFIVRVNGKRLNLSFIPSSTIPNAYAFVNGIEINSRPDCYNNLPNGPSSVKSTSNGSYTKGIKTSSSSTFGSKRKIIIVVGVAVAVFCFLGCFCCLALKMPHGDLAFPPSPTRQTNTEGSSLMEDGSRQFSYHELQIATNNFDESLVIGVGGFGIVYEAHIDHGKTKVAIKRRIERSRQGDKEFQSEVENLSRVRHDNIVQLIGYCRENNEMILVYDYMPNGTLSDLLHKENRRPLSWVKRLEICIAAACGLQFLHHGAGDPIIHRDVKTSNILIDKNWVAKISDFGLARNLGVDRAHVTTSKVMGSYGYVDPTYFTTQQLQHRSDVYSFGVVLWEVLSSKQVVFMEQDESKALSELARQHYNEGRLYQIIDPDLQNEIAPKSLEIFSTVAMACISLKLNKRPLMSEVLIELERALEAQMKAKDEASILSTGTFGPTFGAGPSHANIA